MSERWSTWSPGDRVVVRRRLPDGGPTEHLYTDVLGVVVAVDAGGVTLRPDAPHVASGHAASGHVADPVRVDAADIVLGKRIPPRPVRRPSS